MNFILIVKIKWKWLLVNINSVKYKQKCGDDLIKLYKNTQRIKLVY